MLSIAIFTVTAYLSYNLTRAVLCGGLECSKFCFQCLFFKLL